MNKWVDIIPRVEHCCLFLVLVRDALSRVCLTASLAPALLYPNNNTYQSSFLKHFPFLSLSIHAAPIHGRGPARGPEGSGLSMVMLTQLSPPYSLLYTLSLSSNWWTGTDGHPSPAHSSVVCNSEQTQYLCHSSVSLLAHALVLFLWGWPLC